MAKPIRSDPAVTVQIHFLITVADSVYGKQSLYSVKTKQNKKSTAKDKLLTTLDASGNYGSLWKK